MLPCWSFWETAVVMRPVQYYWSYHSQIYVTISRLDISKWHHLIQAATQAVSPDEICFNSKIYVLSGYKINPRLDRVWCFLECVSWNSRLFPGSWGERSCLPVSNGDLSSKVEESLSGGIFPTEKISRLPGVMSSCCECAVQTLLYQNLTIFNRSC